MKTGSVTQSSGLVGLAEGLTEGITNNLGSTCIYTVPDVRRREVVHLRSNDYDKGID